ncbi:hypothetical protein NA57DRAFT_45105, partial [Rhizodiscina lignyota]
MPPGQKRKRGDANYPTDRNDSNSQRPSPHRPQNMGLAQHNQLQHPGGRGGRQASGNRGGRRGSASFGSREPGSANASAAGQGPASNTTMSPPATNPPPTRAPPVSTPNTPTMTPANPQSTAGIPLGTAGKILPTNFYYRSLTKDRVAAWQDTGKAVVAVVQEANKELQKGILPDALFEELIRATIENRLPAKEAGSVVKELLASQTASAQEHLAEIFLDTLSVMTLNFEARRAEAAIPDVPNPGAIHDLVVATDISADTMRDQLETYLLMACGLTRQTFDRAIIRYTTNHVYRQAAFNLLREESEGYSKLVTEYFTTVQGHIVAVPSQELVDETFMKVKALIGTFDLDVGRVLDVTLDVFSNLLVKHHRFFIKFLRSSSWWPAEKTFEQAEWTDKPFGSLPAWAERDYDPTAVNEEEQKAKKSQLREVRDIAFWQRVEEVGLAAWFELGGRRLMDPEEKAKFENMEQPGSKDEKEQESLMDNNWIAVTGTMPPQGNRIAAQLMGFKLRNYTDPARKTKDHLLDNLIFLAALLIKIGFISLRDLYPHLYPDPETMEKEIKPKLEKEKAERERKSRPGGGMNALLTAGALVDDTLPTQQHSRLRDSNTGHSTPKSDPPGKPEENAKKELPPPADQVIALLKSLLMIGALPESLFILSKHKWLMDLQPELPQYVHRVLHQSISKVYESVRSASECNRDQTHKPVYVHNAGMPQGEFEMSAAVPKKSLKWARMEKYNDEGTDYIFYWEDWIDNVPICQTVNDVFLLCNSFLNVSGAKIGEDSNLLDKLVRIGKYSLANDSSEENFNRWADLCKRLLVPALSLTKCNPGIVNEVWDLIKMFPAATRYSMYAEWHSGPTSRQPAILSAFNQARAETKDVLKRISKTNTKQMARLLAKVAYANPGVVFAVTFNQIESYNNLIEVVVECVRYFAFLGYDVLIWSLLASLGGKSRDAKQGDGMLTSTWLQALSHFTGKVFHRYAVLNLNPILRYVCFQLRQGNSSDLDILQNLVEVMAGISPPISYNEWQIQALAGGGALLREIVFTQTQDNRNKEKTTAKRLMRSLTELPSGNDSQGLLGPQLLVMLAQELLLFPNRDDVRNDPLKVMANNLDRIYQAFCQYLEMLRWNMTPSEFDAIIPDVAALIEDFGISPEIAWTIARPSINAQIERVKLAQTAKEADTQKTLENGDPVGANGSSEGGPAADQVMIEEAKPTPEVSSVDAQSVPLANGTPPVQTPTPPVSAQTSTPTAEEIMASALTPYIDRFKQILPIDFEDNLGIQFYVTFWQFELGDIISPTKLYSAEMLKHSQKYQMIEEKLKPLRARLARTGSKATPQVTALEKESDDERKKASDILSELNVCVARYQRGMKRLAQEKKTWFDAYLGEGNDPIHGILHQALWQHCFLPRILLSASDGLYVFNLIMYLHNNNVPGFRLMRLLDFIFQTDQMIATIFHFTTREAENFSRFLAMLLKLLKSWYSSKETFENAALGIKDKNPTGSVGFAMKWTKEPWSPTLHLTFAQFLNVITKWQGQLCRSISNCMKGGEYMHIRNAIVLLKATDQFIPNIDAHADMIFDALTPLKTHEERQDIKLAATGVFGDLDKRRDKEDFVTVQAFKGVAPANDQTTTTTVKPPIAKAGTPRANTPQPPSNTKVLSASAPTFKPGVNGTTKPPVSGKQDVEDGEI